MTFALSLKLEGRASVGPGQDERSSHRALQTTLVVSNFIIQI